MPHRFLVAMLVDVRRQQRRVETEMLMQKSGQISRPATRQRPASPRGCRWRRSCTRSRPASRPRARVVSGRSVARDGDPFAQLDGRGLVVHSNERQRHWAPNLCTWLKRLAAHTAIITTRHRAGEIGRLAPAQSRAAADQQQQHVNYPADKGGNAPWGRGNRPRPAASPAPAPSR